ncbi:MAG: ABC transporter substrate-binding protein [Alphaproteobacteria bacterium]|nr:ABC transporter substrate-binding protein [Alphaproteobacteria bacterium]
MTARHVAFAAALALGASAAAGPAGAQQIRELVIGSSLAVTSIDPHFHNASLNNAMAKHIFDPLVAADNNQQAVPGLAESWRAVDPNTWEFKLRRGVTFHDGTPFTAEDVAFTLRRAPDVPNSPSSFAQYIRQVTAVEVVDSHTIRLRSAVPFPLMPVFMSTFTIVSRRHGEGASTADYNAGKAAIGTGPYRFVEYVPGNRIVLARNPNYWRGAEPWERVTTRFIVANGPRLAALLARDVHLIDNVLPSDVGRLRADQRMSVWTSPSGQLNYLHMDQFRSGADTPHVRDKSGNPLASNPFRDVRVRRALSMAINRQGLVDSVMAGVGTPASQIVPEGFFGYNPRIALQRFDLEGARRLMAEAGYANGFRLTLHGPQGRYVNEDRITQAVAQMWARLGIEVTVESIPSAVFFPRGSRLEFSAFTASGANFTGEAASLINSLLMTFNAQAGTGTTNRGRYSNPEVDRLMTEAFRTLDDAKRAELLQRAQEVAIGTDVGLIPIFFSGNVWAGVREVRYVVHTTNETLAMNVRPAN